MYGGERVPPVSFVSEELGLFSLFLVSCVSILHVVAVVGSMFVGAPSTKPRRSGEGVPGYAGKFGARGCWFAWECFVCVRFTPNICGGGE